MLLLFVGPLLLLVFPPIGVLLLIAALGLIGWGIVLAVWGRVGPSGSGWS